MGSRDKSQPDCASKRKEMRARAKIMEENREQKDKSQLQGKKTYKNTVVPGKDGKLIESSNKVPSSGGVAGYEDTKREGGKWVHEAPSAISVACRIAPEIPGLWRSIEQESRGKGGTRPSLGMLLYARNAQSDGFQSGGISSLWIDCGWKDAPRA